VGYNQVHGNSKERHPVHLSWNTCFFVLCSFFERTKADAKKKKTTTKNIAYETLAHYYIKQLVFLNTSIYHFDFGS
jgi:endo-1,4-beta-D-glucanase Y